MICFGNCFRKAICKFKCIQLPFIFPQSNKSVEKVKQKQCDKGYEKRRLHMFFIILATNEMNMRNYSKNKSKFSNFCYNEV